MAKRSKTPPSDALPEPEVIRRDLEILRAVRRLSQALDVQSRRLSTTSHVTLPQLLCLMAVVAEEGLTSRRIATEIFASASTLVGVLDRLESKQLIDRVRDPADRRQIHIVPTDAGRDFIATTPTAFGEHFDESFAAMSESEQRQLIESLSLMADLLGAPPSPPTG